MDHGQLVGASLARVSRATAWPIARLVLTGTLVALAASCEGQTGGSDETVQSRLITGWAQCPAFPDNGMGIGKNSGWTAPCIALTHDIQFYMNLGFAPTSGWNDSV